MVQNIFSTILEMSIAADYCAIFVIIIRLFIKKLPKTYSYVLWAIVFLRLLIPSFPESEWSFIPQQVHTTVEYQADAQKHDEATGEAVNGTVDGAVHTISEGNAGLSANKPAEVLNASDQIEGNQNTAQAAQHILTIPVLTVGWVIVALALLGYGVVSSILFKQNLKDAIKITEVVYERKGLQTAFVTGVVKPRIYLPEGIPWEYREYVLAHERVHIKRGDHLVKPLAYVLACVHWFNPLVWVSFMLMCKDMEMSCDEWVLRSLGMEEKKAYSTALLSIASGRKIQLGMPLAFSESDAKSRIKNVLNYRKPVFWVALLAVVTLAVLAFGFLSNPKMQIAMTLFEDVELSEYFEQCSEKEATIIADKPDDFHYVYKFVYESEEAFSEDIQEFLEVMFEKYGDYCIYSERGKDAAKYAGWDYGVVDFLDKTMQYEVAVVATKMEEEMLLQVIENSAEMITRLAQITKLPEEGAEELQVNWEGNEYVLKWDYYTGAGLYHPGNNVTLEDLDFAASVGDTLLLICNTDRELGYGDKEDSFGISGIRLFSRVPEEKADNSEIVREAISGNWNDFLDSLPDAGEGINYWIEAALWQTDISHWFDTYNGEKLQRIPGAEGDNYSPAQCPDIIYYHPGADEDIQTIVMKMISTMVEPLMTPSDVRPFTITEYKLDDQPMYPVDEGVWLIPYLNGYYKYDGSDLVTFEERLVFEAPKNDMIEFLREGSSSVFMYILLGENGVYRLQKLSDMKQASEQEVSFEEAPIYAEDMEDFEKLEEKLSMGMNVAFLYEEFDHINKLDVSDFRAVLFDFADKANYRDDATYYFDEMKLYEAIAQKCGQEVSVFMAAHHVEELNYTNKLYHTVDGDNMSAYVTVEAVKWSEDEEITVYYSLFDSTDFELWNGEAVLKEKNGEMVFVSNKKR